MSLSTAALRSARPPVSQRLRASLATASLLAESFDGSFVSTVANVLVKLSILSQRAASSAMDRNSSAEAITTFSPARRSERSAPSRSGMAYTSMPSTCPSRAHMSTTTARRAAGSTPPPSPTPSCAAGACASATPSLSSLSAVSLALGMLWHASTSLGLCVARAARLAATPSALSRASKASVGVERMPLPRASSEVEFGWASSEPFMCSKTLYR
eukprot:scaffold180942_cov28-Tisochrysis_lutea.AAC.3